MPYGTVRAREKCESMDHQQVVVVVAVMERRHNLSPDKSRRGFSGMGDTCVCHGEGVNTGSTGKNRKLEEIRHAFPRSS